MKCEECGKSVPNANVCPHCHHRHSKKSRRSDKTAEGWSWLIAVIFCVWVYNLLPENQVDNYCEGPVTWKYAAVPGVYSAGEREYGSHVAWDSDKERVIIKVPMRDTEWEQKSGGDGYHRISGSTVYWTSEDTRYRIVAENCD